MNERRVYEIRISGDADKEAVQLLLCPEPEHQGPCEIPWSSGYNDNGLLFGIYASREAASSVADRIRALVGSDRTVGLESAGEGRFDELEEQFRLSN